MAQIPRFSIASTLPALVLLACTALAHPGHSEGEAPADSISVAGVAELEGRVTVFDGSNQVVAHLGDNPQREHWANYRVPAGQWQEGIFNAPHGIAFDGNGNLFVMDWNASGRISRLDLAPE